MPESLPDNAGVMSIGVYDPEDAEAAVGQEFIDKWTNEIITAIKDIKLREKDYEERVVKRLIKR